MKSSEPTMRCLNASLMLGMLLCVATTIGANPAFAAEKFRCHGQVATIVIDTNNPDQQGTSGDDVVVLLDGGHDFSAGAGDDSVCSSASDRVPNTIRGGPGDDFLWPTSSGADQVYGGTGVDEVYGSNGNAGITMIDTGRGDDLVTMTAGEFDVDLGPGDDVASVSQTYDTTVVGGVGNDTLYRTTPNDGVDSEVMDTAFDGGPGSDALSWREYRDPDPSDSVSVMIDAKSHEATGFGRVGFHSVERFIGSSRNDRFHGNAHPDRFHGLGGHDVMNGRGGPDALYGGPGQDIARGGTGRDICHAERRTSCERS